MGKTIQFLTAKNPRLGDTTTTFHNDEFGICQGARLIVLNRQEVESLITDLKELIKASEDENYIQKIMN